MLNCIPDSLSTVNIKTKEYTIPCAIDDINGLDLYKS